MEISDDGTLTDAEKAILSKHRHQLMPIPLGSCRLEGERAGLLPRIVEDPQFGLVLVVALCRWMRPIQADILDLKHLIHELVRIDHGGYTDPMPSSSPLKHADTCGSCLLKRLIAHLWSEDP